MKIVGDLRRISLLTIVVIGCLIWAMITRRVDSGMWAVASLLSLIFDKLDGLKGN
jgi:hypothetical protein